MTKGKEWCQACHGRGVVECCINPDNGHLDTLSHMLEYREVRCDECDGTGFKKAKRKS